MGKVEGEKVGEKVGEKSWREDCKDSSRVKENGSELCPLSLPL